MVTRLRTISGTSKASAGFADKETWLKFCEFCTQQLQLSEYDRDGHPIVIVIHKYIYIYKYNMKLVNVKTVSESSLASEMN